MRALALAFSICLLGSPVVALASSTSIDFESYAIGTIHNQDGWSSSGAAGSGCAVYDHAVVAAASYGYASFGSRSLRISNAVTSGCFGDQTFSKSLTDEAGETTATNAGLSGGTRKTHFEAQWDFASTTPAAEQVGLSVVASPDRGDGSRMSWVQMTDTPTGLAVNFFDVQGTTDPANFVGPTPVETGLDRTAPHTIKITIDFIDGPSNDIVRVYVDGNLRLTGTTWENYYEFDSEAQPEGGPRTVDSILFRTGGIAMPALAGYGFLIDNLSLSTSNAPAFPSQCKDGGWATSSRADGTTFTNQGDCIQYVNTGK